MPSLIVPYHRATRTRARNAWFVRARLQALHPDWPLLFATDGHSDGQWSKGNAVNRCAATVVSEHRRDTPLVIHDADCLVSRQALLEAVDAVTAGVAWAIPHGRVYRLDPDVTRLARDDGPTVEPVPILAKHCQRPPYEGLPGGGILVVSAAAWREVGGFDERFEGWGSEDVSLGYALDALVGPPWRGIAPLWHLWHPAAERSDKLDASQALEARYLRARHSPEAMRELLAER